MAILVLTSAGGAPGVTTLAVGLALTWPRPVLLADCDPGAHQAVLAGYLAGQTAHGKGLLRVAEAHRDRRPLREVVIDQTIPLTGEDGQRRLFLPGFTRVGSASHFGAVWGELADTFDRLSEVGMDVIVDAGRLTADGLPQALVDRSAMIGLVLQSSLRSVVSARVHLPALQAQAGVTEQSSSSLALVVIGEGRPYSQNELHRALGVPVVASITEDAVSAGHLSDGRTRHRKFESAPLVRSLRGAATTLAGSLQQAAELVRS